ncbi:MAG: CPBP family intramembrane metalloprotease [Candidatus Aureabacteria bacterium]|nr:CPBP family intramembrane metalloprotease [Candidatus Auribacterota bacterium]
MMKSYQRLGLVLFASLLLSCVAAPFVWQALQGLRTLSPALRRALDFPFDRVMRRIVLVAAVLLFYGFRKRLDIVSLASMGLRRSPGWRSLLARAWTLGVASLALMLLLMLPFGSRRVSISFTNCGELALGLCVAFLSGCVVAFIEEPIFRGFILQSLLKDLRRVSAVAVMSLFFAIVHFFNASDMPSPAGFDLFIGFKALAYFFQPLLTPSEVIPGFVGLFLMGVVLACAYLWTGSLYPAIGLHAGWVFGIKAESLFLDRASRVAPWFFGDGRVVTGVFGWLMLFLMLLIVRVYIRRTPSR